MIQTPGIAFQLPRQGTYTGYELDGSTVVNADLKPGAVLQLAGVAPSGATAAVGNLFGRPTEGYATPFAVVSEDWDAANKTYSNTQDGIVANLRRGGSVPLTFGYTRALVKHGVVLVAGVTLLCPTDDAFHLTPFLANGLLYASTAASAEHENTTDAADFDKSYTIPANSLRPGDTIRIRALVTVNDNNSTDTVTVLLKFGSVTLQTQAAVDSEDADIAVIDTVVKVRAIGATGKIVCSNMATVDVDATAGPIVASSVSTEQSVDTTATIKIALNADWSVAHADNEVELTDLSIWLDRLATSIAARPVAVAMESTTINDSTNGEALAKVALLGPLL